MLFSSALHVPPASPRLTRRALLRAAVGLAGLSLARCGWGDDSPPATVQTATDQYPETGLLASVDWLAERINDPTLRLIDCSPIRRYRDGHLPGAGHVWWQDTIEIHNPVYGMLAGPPQRAEIVRAAGITPETTVVCYDDRGGQHAARIIWMLHVMGFFNVRLLDGGRQAWRAAGHDLTDATPEPPPGALESFTNEEVIAHGRDIADLGPRPPPVLIDTRTADEREQTWYRRLRRGQIPGSLHVPRTDFLTPDGLALLPPDALLERLQAASVPPAIPPPTGHQQPPPTPIVYGLHGTLACLPYVALRALGYEHVRVYDGSWAEWGANEEWPVEPLPDER